LVLAILALVLVPLSRSSLTLDPLIAEANERARERRELILRLAAAALIFGAALAGAAFLQHLRFVEDASSLLVRVFRVVHPWWLYAAMLALCLLGVAGAATVLATAQRAVTSGYAAASVLFVAAGVAALADTKLTVWINGRMLGRTNLAVALLFLGLVSAVLALTFWSRRQQQHRELSVDPADSPLQGSFRKTGARRG
jgi:hypothetical protein